jgi:hypothetical protein
MIHSSVSGTYLNREKVNGSGDKEIEADKREFTPMCPDCSGERDLFQIIVVPPKLPREDWGEYAAAQMSR